MSFKAQRPAEVTLFTYLLDSSPEHPESLEHLEAFRTSAKILEYKRILFLVSLHSLTNSLSPPIYFWSHYFWHGFPS